MSDSETETLPATSVRGVKPGTRRGYYEKSSLACRQRVLAAAERGDDWASIAEANGIKKSTASNWVRRGRADEKQRGGKRNGRQKVYDIHIEALIDCLNDNCQLALKQLRKKMFDMFGIRVSQSTIANHLEGRMISLKQIHVQPEVANSLNNKIKRKEFVEQLMRYIGECRHVLHTDESNVNLFLRQSRGRSLRGTRAIVRAYVCRLRKVLTYT